ncbi:MULTISPECIES: hypothetical protein [unclassified Paenibacillus]
MASAVAEDFVLDSVADSVLDSVVDSVADSVVVFATSAAADFVTIAVVNP